MASREQDRANRAAEAPIGGNFIVSFRGGDASLLESLLVQHEGPVFRFLFGVLKDHHAAEDALQETFVQAIRYADTISPDAFRGWLFTVAHRQALLIKRKEKRLPAQTSDAVLLDLVGDGSVDTKAVRADDIRRIRELLKLLPIPQRAVIVARIFEGKRFREVAASLGCPLNTALARMHEGLKKLRQLWEAQHV